MRNVVPSCRTSRARRDPRSAARKRRDRAVLRELAKRGGTVAGIPILEVGRRIAEYAQNPLANLIRESYWKAKGERVWRRVCKNSLEARLSASWIWVVRRLGRG